MRAGARRRAWFLAAMPLLLGCATSRPESTVLSAEERSVVAQQAATIVDGADSDRERAQRIYDWVRDEIEYGFTRRFDEADPVYTLEVRRGHCNPQTELLVELMRSAGLEARQRFVTIDADLLDGLFPRQAKPPQELNHSFAEVRLDGEWIRIDGYAVDPALLRGARLRLEEQGREAGFGVHRESCSDWDGRTDCMGQFVDPAWQRTLWEPIEPARAFYAGDGYTQRLHGLQGLLYRRLGVPWMNRALERVREEGEAAVEAPAAVAGDAAGGGEAERASAPSGR